MRTQAGFLTLFSVLEGVLALYDFPNPSPALERRQNTPRDLFAGVRSDVLKRSTHDASFSLVFDAVNENLYDGEFNSGRLNVSCIECHTTGEVTASAMLPDLSDIHLSDLKDIFDDSMLGLSFTGVDANIQIDLDVGVKGEFAVPLFKSESPIGIAGPGYQIGIVFSVDLVLGIAGEIETQGGFKVAIPDGSSYMILLDDHKPNVASFNGSSASLLPVTGNVTADLSVALRLSVQAGVMLPEVKFFEVKAIADAYVSLPEVILGAATAADASSACDKLVSAEVNINAGASVDFDLGSLDVDKLDHTASTTLFAAATTTCLGPVASSSSYSGMPDYSASSSSSSFAPVPTSFAVAPRAMRSGYPITMTSLATPVANVGARPTLVV